MQAGVIDRLESLGEAFCKVSLIWESNPKLCQVEGLLLRLPCILLDFSQ